MKKQHILSLVICSLLAAVVLISCVGGLSKFPKGLTLYNSDGDVVRQLTENEVARSNPTANDMPSLVGYGKILIFPPPESGLLTEEGFYYKIEELTKLSEAEAKAEGKEPGLLSFFSTGKLEVNWDKLLPIKGWGWWALLIALIGAWWVLFTLPLIRDQDGFSVSFSIDTWSAGEEGAVQMGGLLGVSLQPYPTFAALGRRLNFLLRGAKREKGQVPYDRKRIVDAAYEPMMAAINAVASVKTPEEWLKLSNDPNALEQIRKGINQRFIDITGFQPVELYGVKTTDPTGLMGAKAKARAVSAELLVPVEALTKAGVPVTQALAGVTSIRRSQAIERMGQAATPVIPVEEGEGDK